MPLRSIKSLTIKVYNRKMMFLLFLVVMIALTIDIGISNVADIVAKQAVSLLGIALFVVISGIYCVGQFLILEMVKAKNRENRILSSNSNSYFDRVVTIVHICKQV